MLSQSLNHFLLSKKMEAKYVLLWPLEIYMIQKTKESEEKCKTKQKIVRHQNSNNCARRTQQQQKIPRRCLAFRMAVCLLHGYFAASFTPWSKGIIN